MTRHVVRTADAPSTIRRKPKQGDVLVSDGYVYVYQGSSFRLRAEILEGEQRELGRSIVATREGGLRHEVPDRMQMTITMENLEDGKHVELDAFMKRNGVIY